MTREENVEMLNILLDNAKIGCADITIIKHVSFDSFKFVLEQTIKALSQEPTEDKCRYCKHTYEATLKQFDLYDEVFKEQEPCDDAISRIKERIAYYENRKPKDGYDGVSYGKTEDGSGELKNPRKVEYERYSNRQIGLEEALEILQNHSVTQKSETVTEFADRCRECGAKYGKLLKQKSGHWISHYDEDAKEGWYECDRCHTERAFNTRFCPDCGAKMVKPQESEDKE